MTFNTSKLNKVSAKEISENFIKAYPDLLEGAVITKIEISGCQALGELIKSNCPMAVMI